ncbi:MAG: T9SS type A sorting domain-containing protein [Cyclobacteriaceae bacterium]
MKLSERFSICQRAVLFLCSIFGTVSLSAQVNTTDSLALVAIYEATDGDNWTNKENWLTGPVSTWQFVDVEDDKVIRLRINSENNLTGELPPQVGSFTGLDWLMFHNQSNLTGTIPAEIGQLTTLRFLTITNNDLSGEVPATIVNLVSLTDLTLEDNRLTGTLPPGMTNMENLRTINIEGNFFTGLPDFSSLSTLTWLNVQSNQLGFADILKNIDLPITYEPQRVLTEDSTMTVAPGSDITLSFDTSGISAEDFIWLLLTDTASEGEPFIDIEDIRLDPTRGEINATTYQYQLVMTNSAVPDLTLKSGIFYLTVPQTNPVGRQGAVTFMLGEDNYLALGRNEIGYLRDVNEFIDVPSAINWHDKTIFPGDARAEAVSFVIDEIAYVGTGIGVGDSLYRDFYSYTATTDTWTRIADFPGGARYNAVAFSAEGFGYVGTGRTGEDEQSDYWRYDPATDQWQEVASSPAGKRQGAFTFTVRGKVFVGGGFYRDGFTFFQQSDIYEYDAQADQWIERVFADGINLGINNATTFTLYDYGYIYSGNKTDLIKYDPFDHTYENLGNVFELENPIADPFALVSEEFAYVSTDSFGFPNKAFSIIFHKYEEENIPMSDFTLSASAVDENSPSNTLVGILSVTDPDQAFPHTFETSSALFIVSNDSVYTNAAFDHEENSAYRAGFQVTDNRGNTLSIDPLIDVVDINEAPTDISLSATTVAEADGFTEIGQLSATDEDFGDSFTFEIAEEDRDQFSFTSADRLLIEDADFETEQEVSLTVTATDEGGLIITKEFVINIENVNEPPTGISLSNATIDIDSAPGTVVGTLRSEDPEDTEGFVYAITNDANEFALDEADLITTASLNDFSGIAPEIAVTIKSTDPGGLELEETFTISLLNVTDITLPSTLSVYPNPVGDMLIIRDENREATQLRIVDLNGKTVLQRKSGTLLDNSLCLGNLQAGTYLLVIETPGSTHRVKLLKK